MDKTQFLLTCGFRLVNNGSIDVNCKSIKFDRSDDVIAIIESNY